MIICLHTIIWIYFESNDRTTNDSQVYICNLGKVCCNLAKQVSETNLAKYYYRGIFWELWLKVNTEMNYK